MNVGIHLVLLFEYVLFDKKTAQGIFWRFALYLLQKQ